MSEADFEWLEGRDDISHVTVGVVDLQGILRGKRLPKDQAKKVLTGGLKLPLSGGTTDIWGEDLHENELAMENGDADGICQYTGRGVLPVNWNSSPGAFVPVQMMGEDGKPFLGCSRYALIRLMERFHAKGWRPVVATELEFFLYDLEDGRPTSISSPVTGKKYSKADLLSIEQLDHLDDFLSDLHKECEIQGINADTMVSENAASQYEVNLLHVDDPVRAADDTVLFKRLIKGIARKHGMGATFMAKPYGDQAGNSMHVHFSLIDENDVNLFDNGGEEGTEMLRHAAGGLLKYMRESMLMFAPHYNSYKRLRPYSLAPTDVNWGYENRSGAVRIPASDAKARRIEHRVAGADANPYLVLTAMLAAALEGIENKIDPGAPIEGLAYEGRTHESLPASWYEAIELYANSDFCKEIFSETLHKTYLGVKKYEFGVFTSKITEFEHETYLDNV
ncbi:glutamine synthetase family protein [Curvivirga sp.]|uniref:glutamine synthetase family protein n=1 Tax=Curvivirga sp. TaxID=2856848 RepID=UPI003B58FA47